MNRLELILALVAERTGLSPVDPDRLFIDYGIGSADAVALAADLGGRLGVELPTTVFYDHPTARALDRHLSALAVRHEPDRDLSRLAVRQEPDRDLSRLAVRQEQDRHPSGLAVRQDGPGRLEPVAIVGIGCRVPGAAGPEAFWRLLSEGLDAVVPVPRERAGRHHGWSEPGVGVGGFLPDVQAFDRAFFSINAREAAAMDPQQRMLLEVAHESLQDAGIRANDLAGSQTGVFVGISSGDFLVESFSPGSERDGYTPTGAAHSVAANRISYVFDLHGPSMAVDTACSSSLVAVHQAVIALQTGQCDTALAGGVNAILTPDFGLCFRTAGVLAPDGRCKSFGAKADGMGRSEGAVVLALRRLSDAEAAGDRVYALILGGAVNSDGRTNGLMSPSAPAQARLLRAACSAAGVEPGEIGYVEAHGSGTKLGDLMELRALSEVLGGRGGEPVRVGSVKSNIAHLEAAAGAAGLAKLALALHRGVLPASLHADEPADDFDWGAGGLAVQTRTEPWAGRVAGVSSFGFGGTNAHLILQAPPRPDPGIATGSGSGVLRLPLSAHTPAALRALTERWLDALADPGLNLAAACHTAVERRDHHAYRLAVSGADASQLTAELERALTALVVSPPPPAAGGPVALVFTGGHAFDAAQGRAYDAAHERALGLVEAGAGVAMVIGHGSGEVAAAAFAGVLSPGDAALVTAQRARLLAPLAPVSTLRVRLAPRLAAALCERVGARAAVSLHEDAQTCVLAGPPAELAKLTAALAGSRVLHDDLGPATPDHSGLAAEIAGELRSALEDLPANVGHLPLVSSLTGAPLDGRAMGARHWVRQLCEPSRLGEALDHAIAQGVRTFVELGPGLAAPLLRARTAAVVRCATDADVPAALIRLYELGHDPTRPTPAASSPPMVSIPLLPWSRRPA
ncbi:type I polyketide synthase [Nonomuraea soli]|uniref:Acyl transferase domain-containing protein/acyl carrier protein n=1 Tax=Nonomuraea soli TaxID=1032476 RepID=A0A7W0CSP4_9ACTN|nr:type I polyketide synthase [Nonomuraea soli]MBA2896580.1 acyl transferase domain-containing protein/acyl carrier protein [Nonomuraea soli]